MRTVYRDIFRAIHEDKWLSIEYRNKGEEVTKYWIGIKNILVSDKMMLVEGLHLALYETRELRILIDSIISTSIIEGSFFSSDEKLKEDIKLNPQKYKFLFNNVANLKVLNYLVDCNRLDCIPYKSEYALIEQIDGDCFNGERFQLSKDQFKAIVSNFQINAQKKTQNIKTKQLALNIMSINTKQGLYVLAYRKLKLDVIHKCLLPDDNITICTEFTINGNKQSIRQFLDADDYALLDDFEDNLEIIKNKITELNKQIRGVDDMPYLIAIGRDHLIDLHKEYAEIVKMFEEERVTDPIKAFFGELVKIPEKRKTLPIALLNKRVNLDQLLAINNAIKYPLAYIQGPPGTGKTNTIINTIMTAFFNGKTVLLTSYNNHPIDAVYEILSKIKYKEKGYIPFPIVRLGNNEKVKDSLDIMKNLYEQANNTTIYESTLSRKKDSKVAKTSELTALLKKHEEKLDLIERKEALDKLWSQNQHFLNFQTQLKGIQQGEIEKRLEEIGDITDEEALRLVIEDEEEFKKYLYYTSAQYIQKMGNEKNQELLRIIYLEDQEERVKQFNSYLSKEENVKSFLQIFPIIATTAASACKIGEPGTYFDMTVMDEASQGNIAVSLVPIIRSKSLMLVGDPQQLSPVIVLDPKDNIQLKKNYGISDEYDYIKNSIYKAFLACDSMSSEVLLSHHYRCNEKIINFNNKKYYNNKLVINSQNKSENPLIFCDIPNNTTYYKNTAPNEADEIIKFIKLNKDKSIGIITPFTNQKDYINEELKKNSIKNVSCGTVHAFQGDEKDVILFSLALTDKTYQKTYDWLKNNKELINVATSRAKDQLIVVSSKRELDRLHIDNPDDMYELISYVQSNGNSIVTPRINASRALGIKPYSTETEKAFLENLTHALGNVLYTNQKCEVEKEVSIAHVFNNNTQYNDLFYTGRFDFVVYEKDFKKNKLPILAIELDGKEHFENEVVKERDRKKNEICRQHGFELIRIENSYARRYNYMKEILIKYFKSVKAY